MNGGWKNPSFWSLKSCSNDVIVNAMWNETETDEEEGKNVCTTFGRRQGGPGNVL
jgi:hypothetical protein